MASLGEALLDAFASSIDLDRPHPGGDRTRSGGDRPDPDLLWPDPDGRDGRGPGPDRVRPEVDFIVGPASAVDGVAVTVADPVTGDPRIVYASDNLAALLGYDDGQLVGRPLANLFGDEASVREVAGLEARLAQGEEVGTSHMLRRRDGTPVAVHVTHAPLPTADRGTGGRLLLVRDLSRRPSERLFSDQAVIVDSLARGQDLGSLCHEVASSVEARLVGAARCWIGVNDAADRMEAVVTAGHDVDEVTSVLRLVMGAGDPTSARCVLVENLPVELRRSLTEAGWFALWAFPTLDRNRVQRGALVVVHRHDELPTNDDARHLHQLSKLIAAGIERSTVETALAHRALHDPLTRLPNRALLVDRLEHALARLERDPSSLSVLLVDIDRFKSVNDTWGTEVGDRVLLEVASRLLASVRLGDTVGRLASDQFLMVCVAGADFDAALVARRIIRTLQVPMVLAGGGQLRISASVGVVAVDDPALSASTVIGRAESALATATAQGRGRFAFYEHGQQRDALAHHELEQALHAAIEGDQLVVHYQPVAEIRTGRMVGAEALVRWDRPGHGLLGPGEFIDIAEETGLIVALGSAVIERVASDLSRWPRSGGLWPVVTVNLSARQLADETLVPSVREVLARHRLPPIRLGFEVTESMRIDDFEAAIDALDALAALGCRIAVDDFGIGYATLDYLRRFSMANVLKIDRSFVAGLGRSREDTAIVSASMALATALQLQVVAEGVEELEQLELLARLGCHYAQGFALSRPVPFDEALALWERAILFDPPTIDG